MWNVTHTDYAKQFEQDSAPVFVFLCDGYKTSSLKWLIDNWTAIHRNAGKRWHMLVPTIDPIDDHSELASTSNYNVDLAREIASIYGIKKLGDPLLILDNFDDSRRQLIIKLPDQTNYIRAIMQDITNISIDIGTKRSRSFITDQIYNELQKNILLRQAVRLAPSAASALLRLPRKSD